MRSDIDSRRTRNCAALGIQGLAPYFFDLEVTGFASGEGQDATDAEMVATYREIWPEFAACEVEVERRASKP